MSTVQDEMSVDAFIAEVNSFARLTEFSLEMAETDRVSVLASVSVSADGVERQFEGYGESVGSALVATRQSIREALRRGPGAVEPGDRVMDPDRSSWRGVVFHVGPLIGDATSFMYDKDDPAVFVELDGGSRLTCPASMLVAEA